MEQQTTERPRVQANEVGGVAGPSSVVRGPNALALREPDMRWLDTPVEELRDVLSNSLYPGAKPESIEMVIGYCKAAGLNIMLKPVHIVPMNVKVPGQRDKYEWRDVVMPGINHYRVQASRTGTYLGKSPPKYGPMVERSWDQFKMMVPEWCEVTVKRLVGSHVAEFTAQEFWDENYATKGRDTKVPNAMWQKRPSGQIHKCAEAQALRMAFPELVADVTAEEMEGKIIDLTAEEIPQKQAAVKHLDDFAGKVDNSGENSGLVAEGDAQPEDAVIEEIEETDEAPSMPDEAFDAFYNTEPGDWHPGWKWLNETFDGEDHLHYTQRAKQEVAERYCDLLWAVFHSDAKAKKGGGPQSKAAAAFTEKHGMKVPAPMKAGK